MTQYDNIADKYANMKGSGKNHILLPTLDLLVKDENPESLLDLGCGYGFFTRILAEKFSPKRTIGVDISEKMIQKAVESENEAPLGIEYIVKDVNKLNLNTQFNLVTAVYLLNYAETEKELQSMCYAIAKHTKKKFCTITAHPKITPMDEIRFGRRYTNPDSDKEFKDGNRIRCEYFKEGKDKVEFTCFYWSRKVYDNALKNAGFKKVRWVEPIISEQGLKSMGQDFWDDFKKKVPSAIGIVCEK